MKIQRAALYIRVSTFEQAVHGKSLVAQRDCLTRYAEDHDMTIVNTYADEGQTARKELKKRKAIHQLLADVRQNKIDVILFWKMDRWFRSVADFYKVQEVLDTHGVHWIAVAEPNINLETRDGRLQLNIMLSIGQNEVDTTSERIRFTVNNVIDRGGLVWGEKNLGFGYMIENGKMVKDPETAPMVEDFYKYFRTHQNKSATVRHMQDTYGIDFSYSMLRTMLSSEFYIGRYRNNSNYCPAYLTEDEWAEVQRISQKNVRQNASDRVYYFTGLMRCPLCGQKLVGTGCSMRINRKTSAKKTYCYYRCNRALIDHICTYRHRVSQILMETYLLDNLESLFSDFEVREYNIGEKTPHEKKKRSPKNVQDEMKRLNLIFQKGRIPYEEYETQYEKLEQEYRELCIVPMPEKKDHTHVREVLESNFRGSYAALTPENKRAFWRGIIESIVLDENHQIKEVNFL